VADLGIGVTAAASATAPTKLEALLSSSLWPKVMLLAVAAGGASILSSRTHDAPVDAPVPVVVAPVATPPPAPPAPDPPPAPALPSSSAVEPQLEVPAPTVTASAPVSTTARVPVRPTQDLAREQRMLAGVQPAIAAGDAARALRLVERHALEFPQGALVEEREALRVLSLRAAGQAAEAERAKASFGAQFPESVLEQRVDR
jgi:hypothetical protein